MISVAVTISDKEARSFLIAIDGDLTNRRDLNEVLADRLVSELRAHFTNKNREPNKMAAPKTNFWNKIADETNVAEITESGATVSVAEERFNIHLFGGTIVPKLAKFLTIPLIKEARGESAASYKLETGHRLFTIPGRNALFEKAGGDATESRVGFTRGRNRSFAVPLAAKQGIRPVFALAKSARIKADPDALPPSEKLAEALQEEAEGFLAAITQGGPA